MEVYHLPHQNLEENIDQSDPRDLESTVVLLVVFPPPPVPLGPVLLVVFLELVSAYILDIHCSYYIRYPNGDQ
jgi:hypothetical protein